MSTYRIFTTAFKRQVAQEFLAGASLNALGRKHEVARNLNRIWVAKYQAGEYEPDFIPMPRFTAHEVKIAELERMVGKLTMELEFLRGVLKNTIAERRAHIDRQRASGLAVKRGYAALMNLARSTDYSPAQGQRPQDARLVEKIGEICIEYPRYGYRRLTAQLRGDGFLVNHKKALRIRREQSLSVRPKRRYVVTTDSNHDGPIFRNLVRNTGAAGGVSSLSLLKTLNAREAPGFLWLSEF